MHNLKRLTSIVLATAFVLSASLVNADGCESSLRTARVAGPAALGPNSLPLFREQSPLFSIEPVTTQLGKDSLLIGQIVRRQPLGTAASIYPKTWSMIFYNVENLFFRTGRFERTGATSFTPIANIRGNEKSPEQVEWQKNIFSQSGFNQAILEEVGAKDDLDGFFKDARFKNRFISFLQPGNEKRGFDIGMVAQNDVPFEAIYVSYKTVNWVDPVENEVHHVFLRDLPVMILKDLTTREVALIVVGVHGKSKRDRPGDPGSNIWRQGEYAAVEQIVRQLLAEFGPNARIVVGGDFNTETRGTASPSLVGLKKILSSAFDVAANHPQLETRVTHTHHPRGSETSYSQLDDAFVSPALKARVRNARVIRYRTRQQSTTGTVVPMAQSYDERNLQPSDHLPIAIELDISH